MTVATREHGPRPQESLEPLRQGIALFQSGHLAESAQSLLLAAKARPDSLEVFSRLGSVYYALKDFARAGECFTRCLQLAPRCAEAHCHLGNVCAQLRLFEKARWLYDKAASLQPDNFKIWNNLGACLRELDALDEALNAYDRALALCPTDASIHCNRAVALLAAGRWQEAWREYEWRRQLLGLRHYPKPSWQGESLPDRTLFLFAEQGLGDMIQFVRFVRLARKRVGRVILECPVPLRRLFEWSDCADQYCTCRETPPAFDCYAPLMSLPGIFNTTPATLPATVPYLRAPDWELLPPAPSGHLKVGLVWAANPKNQFGNNRSLKLEQLAPLFSIPNITFFSLQISPSPEDRCRMKTLKNLVDLSDRLHDFADTAALAAHLDLILTVDTAMAHLAGSLARHVWTLVPFAADWRWERQGTTSPWYPTLRLFRQPQQDHWAPAIAQASQRLALLTHQH